MSYKDKLATYQGDCKILLGSKTLFSDYIKEFSANTFKNNHGLDLGTGPGGCNSKFFNCILDGCDAEPEVVSNLKENQYNKKFVFILGKDILPYEDETLDFVVCSCVIQHLNGIDELMNGIKEISRVLKVGGFLYLMYKVGSHGTKLTHYNEYYNEERTFQVFSTDKVNFGAKHYSLNTFCWEYLLDDNYIPYSRTIFQKTL